MRTHLLTQTNGNQTNSTTHEKHRPLVSGDSILISRTPLQVELQFYTSAAAIVMQLPVVLYQHRDEIFSSSSSSSFSDAAAASSSSSSPAAFASATAAAAAAAAASEEEEEDEGSFAFLSKPRVVALVLVACCFYHLQSVAAYYCVATVSPVTMAVSNTLKRGLLIVLSIVYFGNVRRAQSPAESEKASAGGSRKSSVFLCLVALLLFCRLLIFTFSCLDPTHDTNNNNNNNNNNTAPTGGDAPDVPRDGDDRGRRRTVQPHQRVRSPSPPQERRHALRRVRRRDQQQQRQGQRQ